MSSPQHRVFNADRFLDKFSGHEPILAAHLARWHDRLPHPPALFTVAAFKTYLKSPPHQCPAFEAMVAGLYHAYDLSTKQGHELMADAIEQSACDLPGLHDLPREVLALRLQIEAPATFELATHYLWASQVDKFVTYRGKGPRAIADVPAAVDRFTAQLGALFAHRKGTDKVVVQHFAEADVLNFIVYHERRMTAEIELKVDGGSVVVKSRTFRPARQDFLAYYPETGRLEIETPIKKERDLMRTAFAECCLGESDFFSGEGAEASIHLQNLAAPDFTLAVDDDHKAVLREIVFALPQTHAPTITVNSKDALASLDLNALRPTLAAARIKSARIALAFGEGKRPKSIELGGTNMLSFNRATRASDVLAYLRRWQLLAA